MRGRAEHRKIYIPQRKILFLTSLSLFKHCSVDLPLYMKFSLELPFEAPLKFRSPPIENF